ncbi:hypothetical protein DFR50_12281 [Roseiarcus fermentans]|uniref:Uncharacterized protein n=1 Tax=Roseiarcus fermentans TaxID=1473586 RepID=A0A366F3R3_9HYPH|nr:hypothetical protein [Roseiarcus fermentans]RBP09244.1 hypothetical protein DFR50_12281 [Roseiarcus fermentans]
MNTLSNSTLALGLSLVFASPHAAFAAGAPDPAPQPSHHRLDPFAKARALVPPAPRVAAPAGRVPETDGLSRNTEECNYGCIDD